MAIRTCSSCGQTYRSSLKTCPFCSTANPAPESHTTAIIIGSVVVGLVLVGAIVGKSSDNHGVSAVDSSDVGAAMSPPPEPEAQLPADLVAFDAANADAIPLYEAADNDLKKSVVRKQRDAAVKEAVPGGSFIDWPGTLVRLSTTGDGNAWVQVKPDGCPCVLATTNNEFSEALSMGSASLIKMGTPLFDKLSNMHEGDRVRISGQIFREYSVTEAGSVGDPAWLTRFSDVSPQ